MIRDINQGDFLTFKAADNKYKAILCTSTCKDKSPQNFTFAALNYDNVEKPTIEELVECEFYGIGNAQNDYFKYSNQELEQMWQVHPEINPYFLGSYGFIIWRKDFMKFRENFEIIGNQNIVDNLDKNGNGSINSSEWNFIKDFFAEKLATILDQRGQNQFKVKAIILNN